jgi:hypothetical protein
VYRLTIKITQPKYQIDTLHGTKNTRNFKFEQVSLQERPIVAICDTYDPGEKDDGYIL